MTTDYELIIAYSDQVRHLERELRDCEMDLADSTETLCEIWRGCTNPENKAKSGLRGLKTSVECPFCYGTKVRGCGAPGCFGGHTFHGDKCGACDGKGETPCEECKGKGEI